MCRYFWRTTLGRAPSAGVGALFPELYGPNDPWPTNAPNPPRATDLVAYAQGQALGMGAHRPLDATATETRRVFVLNEKRRQGVARVILRTLEEHALVAGFSRLRLETGCRQVAAKRLYEDFGFIRIAPFGDYRDDRSSVGYEKALIGTSVHEA